MKIPKRIEFFHSLIILLLFLVGPALAQNDRGIKLNVKRHALVIGNSAYQKAPLKKLKEETWKEY